MAKENEINYLKLLGVDGTKHSLNKPYSDSSCGRYLIDIGLALSLMPPPPARLLDVGVGSGWTSIFYSKRGYEVVGLDIAPNMIELANINKDRYQAQNLQFFVKDYEDIDYKNEFDIAIFYDCLHHADDEELALQKVYDSLKNGGMCLALEPGEGHSVAPTSIEAKARFGVTEKDMPPWHIINLGSKIGFSKYRLYQRPQEPVLLSQQSKEIPYAISSAKKVFLHIAGMAFRFLKNSFSRYPVEFRQSNIVVLIK